MSYSTFLRGIDDLIRHGDIEPIWWRTVRSPAYVALLKRTGVVKGPYLRALP